MAFDPVKVQELLAKCHRRCCICHRFCGVKIETDHIEPAQQGGKDTIDNAIPVCFECHAEIHSYNDKHPRGRKFQPEELRANKKQWLDICANTPEALINAARNADVGPLQALVDELDFNKCVAGYPNPDVQGCRFEMDQFKRAISDGAIALLNDKLKRDILEAYVAIGRANEHIACAASKDRSAQTPFQKAGETAAESIKNALPKIKEAMDTLLKFLSSEEKAS